MALVKKRYLGSAIFAMVFCSHTTVQATNSLIGTYTATLEGTGDTSQLLATLEITEDGHSVNMQETLFSDHFLSMRPFRCFEERNAMWCHLPYPYEKPASVTSDDLRSVEYDFLFIHRSASDYGIDPWNGLYFKLSENTDQNGSTELVGSLHEVDLNILASPPDAGVVWPLSEGDLHLNDSDQHIFNKIRFKLIE